MFNVSDIDLFKEDIRSVLAHVWATGDKNSHQSKHINKPIAPFVLHNGLLVPVGSAPHAPHCVNMDSNCTLNPFPVNH